MEVYDRELINNNPNNPYWTNKPILTLQTLLANYGMRSAGYGTGIYTHRNDEFHNHEGGQEAARGILTKKSRETRERTNATMTWFYSHPLNRHLNPPAGAPASWTANRSQQNAAQPPVVAAQPIVNPPLAPPAVMFGADAQAAALLDAGPLAEAQPALAQPEPPQHAVVPPAAAAAAVGGQPVPEDDLDVVNRILQNNGFRELNDEDDEWNLVLDMMDRYFVARVHNVYDVAMIVLRAMRLLDVDEERLYEDLFRAVSTEGEV